MRFSVEHETRNAGRFLERLISIVGWRVFEKRIETLQEERRRAPVLSDFYRERHAVEFELGRFVSHKRKTSRWPRKFQSKEIYDALSFAAMFASVYARLNQAGQNKLRNQVRGYLKGNASLTPILHEMTVAAHLMSQGWDVDFADLEGSARFDFLAARGAFEVEIDCKTVSADLGRKIHRKDFRRLANHLHGRFYEMARGSKRSRLLVRLEVEDRLSSNDTDLKTIAEGVLSAAQSREARFEAHDFLATAETMEAAGIDPARPESIISFIVEILGYQPNAFWVVSGTSVVLLIAVSQKPDEVLEGFYRQLKRAQHQFSGTRPAVLWAQMEGVDRDEWPKLNSKSGLPAMSYRYLRRSSKPHICALAYSSAGTAFAKGGGIQESGPVLYFNHKESLYYDERLELLFAPH